MIINIVLYQTRKEYEQISGSVITEKNMPKIFEWEGYKFFFFSNEGNPPELCHVHVRKNKSIAKYWILPEVTLDSSWGMSSKELNILQKKIIENQNLIEEKWNEFFNQ